MKRLIWLFVALVAGCEMSETNRIVPGATMTFTGDVHQGWEWSYFEGGGEKFFLWEVCHDANDDCYYGVVGGVWA